MSSSTTIQLHSKLDRLIHSSVGPVLFFSGTSYLGMSANTDFSRLVGEGLAQFGLVHGLSRANNVQLAVYTAFEEAFAKGGAAEKALLCSSGFLAGRLALELLLPKVQRAFYAPDIHPAVLPSTAQPSLTASFQAWQEEVLTSGASLPKGSSLLVAANACDPLGLKVHDFHWLEELVDRYRVYLLVDDSHAFGLLGAGLFGTYSSLPVGTCQVLVSGSLAKGLGLPGGIILGEQSLLKELQATPAFRGASPMPPAYAAAFLEARQVYEEAQGRLQELLHYMQLRCLQAGLAQRMQHHPQLPVWRLPTGPIASHLLEEERILISSFPYPAADSPALNRIVLSAWHRKEDVDRLVEALGRVLPEDA
ncbi:MAG: aminotransferase class I/II-fold pyridoxal phosphate-dependent enzyme [Nitritalea sp.]